MISTLDSTTSSATTTLPKKFYTLRNKEVPRGGYGFKIYLNELRTHGKRLNRRQEASLSKRCLKGDALAIKSMVNANLQLVVIVAREFEDLGLPIEDLVSEGNLGLFEAAERFDPSRGYRFQTYAVYWIREKIRKALAEQSRPLKLPVHLSDTYAKIKRTEDQLYSELERKPTETELAERVGIKEKRLRTIRNTVVTYTISFDATHTPAGHTNRLSMIMADEKTETPDVVLQKKMRSDVLQNALSELTDLERYVIKARFGFSNCDGKTLTLRAVSRKVRCTYQYIETIQNKALKRLWKLLRAGKLSFDTM